MNKADLAVENFKTGLNCAQAVVLSFKDELNMDEQTLKKLAIGYGGAVLGMTMVLSYLLSDGNDKLAIYSIIQSACKEFKDEVGSIICRELLDGETLKDKSAKPEERTDAYYKKRPCAELCAIASRITEKYLKGV